MRIKPVGVFLVLLILLAFATSAHSGQSWGIRTTDYGPIVVTAPAHPWGEQASRSTHYPPCYRSGSGYGSAGIFHAPIVTDFVTQFFFSYVVRQEMDKQNSLWKYKGSK
jgi:hypothetical protein